MLKRKKWVVYCKKPFGGAHQAYRYISRYTHRVAISNHRLVSLSDGKLTFRARDNRRPGQHRLVTITAQEFIRRFLLHILPARFVKIRHFGLMAPCSAKTKLEAARALIPDPEPTSGSNTTLTDSANDTRTWQEIMRSLTGMDFTTCPQCGKGRLVRFRLCSSHHLAPPVWDSS
jgi:hypothetical protein